MKHFVEIYKLILKFIRKWKDPSQPKQFWKRSPIQKDLHCFASRVITGVEKSRWCSLGRGLADAWSRGESSEICPDFMVNWSLTKVSCQQNLSREGKSFKQMLQDWLDNYKEKEGGLALLHNACKITPDMGHRPRCITYNYTFSRSHWNLRGRQRLLETETEKKKRNVKLH